MQRCLARTNLGPGVQNIGGSGNWLSVLTLHLSKMNRFIETREIVFAFWKCSCVDRAAENSSQSALVSPQAMFCQILGSLQKFGLSQCYDKRQSKKNLMGRNTGGFEAFSLSQFSFTPPYTEAKQHFCC